MLNRKEIYDMYVMRVKKMEKKKAIEYIEKCIFDVDMIDRWSEDDKTFYNVLCEIERKLRKGEIECQLTK